SCCWTRRRAKKPTTAVRRAKPPPTDATRSLPTSSSVICDLHDTPCPVHPRTRPADRSRNRCEAPAPGRARRVGRGEPAPRHVGPLSPCGCGGKTRSYLLERHHGTPQVSGGATLLAGSSSPSRRSGGQSFSRLASSKFKAIHTIIPMTAKTTGSASNSSHTDGISHEGGRLHASIVTAPRSVVSPPGTSPPWPPGSPPACHRGCARPDRRGGILGCSRRPDTARAQAA